MREVDQYFIDEYELAEDEWFFNKDSLNIGCMMKFNKDGSLPKTVKNWSYEGAPIYLMEEYYRDGWSIGKIVTKTSSTWLMLKHPLGFLVEVNPYGLGTILDNANIENGIIMTKCMYDVKNKRILLENI